MVDRWEVERVWLKIILNSNQNSNPNCKNNSEQYTLEDNPKVYWHGSLVKQYELSSIVTKFNCDLGAVIVSFFLYFLVQ